MLVNLVPEFLATLAAPDPSAAYHEYLDRHRPLLSAYWQNYVLDPDSPHAEPIIDAALRADRSDLKGLLEDVDVVAIAEEALRRATEMLEADCPIDLYLMVGVGAANAGELVVGGRGVAFVCLEHFTGRANAQTYGMGLEPQLLPLWIAHEVAHALRYTSPSRRGSTRGSTSATIAASIGGCASSTSSCGALRRMTSTAPGSDSGSAISRAVRARLHDWWPAKCFPSARATTSAGGWLRTIWGNTAPHRW